MSEVTIIIIWAILALGTCSLAVTSIVVLDILKDTNTRCDMLAERCNELEYQFDVWWENNWRIND